MEIYAFLLVFLSKLNAISTQKDLTCLKRGNEIAGLGATVNGFLTKKWLLPNDNQQHDFCFNV